MSKTVDALITKISGTTKGSKQAARMGMGAQGNFLNNALGSFSSNPTVRAEARFGLGINVAQGAGQAVSGMFSMMPDVSATMDRMATSYNATLRAGVGMSRNQVQMATLNAMRGGLTSPGSDAMTGGYLAMRGMMASAEFGSTYQQTLRSVSGAAQYLNMSNERAVAAVEGLTSGPMAANMLRNFGIFTSDPRTGKERTQGQMFGELYGRLTAGRGTASEEQVLESFRRGTLGATLRASGMSEDQQQMFVQYAIERARGNEMDLSDPETVAQLNAKAKAEGNENPNLPGYNLNTTKTGAMQDAQESYLAGLKMITPVLQGVTAIGGILAGTFGFLNAAAAAAAGNLAFMGAAGAMGGVGKAAGGAMLLGRGKGAGGGGVGVIGTGGKGGIGGKVGGAVSRAGSALRPVAGPAILGAVAGNVIGTAISSGAEEGSTRDRLGGMVSGATNGAAMGAMFGSFLGPKGMAAGAIIGGLVGGATGFFGEGGDEGSSNTNGSGKPQAFKLMHPTKSAKITATFGQRESSFTKGKITWPNGHKGIDYAGKLGDTIYASESGYATLHDGGQLGKRVRIKHENGMYTHYCHLDSITIREGEISKGKPVGTMGNTGGKSTGVHLHFALSTGPDTGSAIDPMPYLGGGGNYLSSPPQDAEQEPSSTNPTSAGSLSGASNPGGEDSSPISATEGTNNVPGAKVDGIGGGSGSSPATGLESYSAGSHYSSGGGASTAAAPEGGEGASDQPGYLSTPSNPTQTTRQKNGRDSRAVTNNVTINLSIAKGTPEEAKRFSYMLKQALEDDHALRMMARK
jgi:hypothetical protein